MDTFDVVSRLIQQIVDSAERAGRCEQQAITAETRQHDAECKLRDLEYKYSNADGKDHMDIFMALLKALSECNPIEAIKQYRALTGFGLKEAKDKIEKVVNGVRAIHNWPSSN